MTQGVSWPQHVSALFAVHVYPAVVAAYMYYMYMNMYVVIVHVYL